MQFLYNKFWTWDGRARGDAAPNVVEAHENILDICCGDAIHFLEGNFRWHQDGPGTGGAAPKPVPQKHTKYLVLVLQTKRNGLARGGAAPKTIPPAIAVLVRPTGYIFTAPFFQLLLEPLF